MCNACAYAFEFRKYSQGYLWKKFFVSHCLEYRKHTFCSGAFLIKILSNIVWTRGLLLQPISRSWSKKYALLTYKLHKNRACDIIILVHHDAQNSKQMLSEQNSGADYRRPISRSSLLFTSIGSLSSHNFQQSSSRIHTLEMIHFSLPQRYHWLGLKTSWPWKEASWLKLESAAVWFLMCQFQWGRFTSHPQKTHLGSAQFSKNSNWEFTKTALRYSWEDLDSSFSSAD